MKIKLFFLALHFCFFYNYSEINFKLQPLSKGFEQTDLNQKIVINDDLVVFGNFTSAGVITSFNGIKVNSGQSRISGSIFLNPYTADTTSIGNTVNGGNVSLSAGPNNQCTIQAKNIILKSPNITVPNTNFTLPLTVDSQGIIKTLYSTRKMKEMITPIFFNLAAIDSLSVYKYRYTAESNLPQGEEWGFIAEELIGTPLEDCIIKNTYDEIININERKLFAFSIGVIKTLIKKVQDLEEQIKKIELSQKAI